MKSKIVAFLICMMMLVTIFVSAGSNITDKNVENISVQKTALFGDDVPTWEEGTVWTYKIDNFDFTFAETEGRSIDFHLSTSELKLKVATETGPSYRTEFEANIELEFDINIDLYIEDKDPIIISGSLLDATIEGDIYFDKSTLGIRKIDGYLTGVMKINSTSPINLQFLASFPIPITLNLDVDFDEPYTFIDFPINADETWGLPQINVTIDGEIRSIWLRLANVANKILSLFGMGFIPPELAQFLPIVDISEVLNAFNISDKMPLPKVPDIFESSSQKSITVEAGTYDAYDISILDGIGNMYYSPEVGMILKMTGNFNDMFPFMQDINIELSDIGEEQLD